MLLLLGCPAPDGEHQPAPTDENHPCSDPASWSPDLDEDGYGSDDPSLAVVACEAPEGHVATLGDCDDAAPGVHPGVNDPCDGIDQDCDGTEETPYDGYLDADFDGFGDPDEHLVLCGPSATHVDNQDDCDDAKAEVHPGAVDMCDGVDTDCDQSVDEDALDGWQLVSVDHVAHTVWRVDRATGALSVLSTLDITDEELPTMDVRDDSVSVVYDAHNLELNRMDACDGTLDLIGASGAGKVCGVAFGPGGVLFGMDNSDDVLVRFDLATGEAFDVGPLGMDIGACGLAYDCTTGRLMGIDAATDTLFEVSAQTGSAMNAVTLQGVNFIAVGVEYDPVTQTILASTRDSYVEIEPGTGAVTTLGSFPGLVEDTHINDLAYYPECP